MPRIAVVGVVVDDRIHHTDGRVTRGIGGIAYAVGALSALGGTGVEIVPLCRLAADIEPRVAAAWADLGNVDLRGCIAWEGPGSRVELRYRGGGAGGVGGDRDERLVGPTPPLTAGEVDAARDCDAILVNCICGPVVVPQALEQLVDFAAPLHLDVHSLMLGIDASGKRYPSRPSEWRTWTDAATTVQCNEQEAATLAGDPAAAASRWRPFMGSLVANDRRTEAVVVTRGAAGADLLTGSPPLWRSVPAPAVAVRDPTGAGDCFGAAFVLARGGGADLVEATRFGVAAGSASCEGEGIAGLAGLGATRLVPKLPMPRRVD